ncbi:MAG: GFA family protein, partial [Paracoccaceae bacterium]
LASQPLVTHCCHCSYCQRETGTAFALNALIEADRVELLSGDLEESTIPSASGRGLIMVRCQSCHTLVWSHYLQDRYICWVRVGTLINPSAIEPDVHIFTDSKLPWVTIPEAMPKFREFYDWDNREGIWSKESIKRDDLIMAKLEADQQPT